MFWTIDLLHPVKYRFFPSTLKWWFLRDVTCQLSFVLVCLESISILFLLFCCASISRGTMWSQLKKDAIFECFRIEKLFSKQGASSMVWYVFGSAGPWYKLESRLFYCRWKLYKLVVLYTVLYYWLTRAPAFVFVKGAWFTFRYLVPNQNPEQ